MMDLNALGCAVVSRRTRRVESRIPWPSFRHLEMPSVCEEKHNEQRKLHCQIPKVKYDEGLGKIFGDRFGQGLPNGRLPSANEDYDLPSLKYFLCKRCLC